MYKNKYLKYKNKYLSLKFVNLFRNNGGKSKTKSYLKSMLNKYKKM